MKFMPMLNRFRQSSYASKVAALCAVLIVGVAGYTFISTRAASPFAAVEAESGTLSGSASIINDSAASAGKAIQFGTVSTPPPTTGLLQPNPLGFAPYAYISWEGSNLMAAYSNAVGTNNFYAAFINASSGCNLAWDGDASMPMSSDTQHLADINAIKAKGGNVVVSFGGDTGGTDMMPADTCTNVSSLQAAYQSVITKYGISELNFDIEGVALGNSAGLARNVQALAALQKANPSVKVSVTLPADTSGLSTGSGNNALGVVQQMYDGGVVLSSVGIMAMEFGVSGAQTTPVEQSATSTASQIQKIYGVDATTAWKAINLIVEIGKNYDGNTFSVTDAQNVKAFVTQKGIGTISMWETGTDTGNQYGNVFK
ncbi:MAG TPA: hypothetical protein VMR45_05020 [Patescibacteria group bacterium]|nr:hypothetical protein [Patescibacteria group bacterium]